MSIAAHIDSVFVRTDTTAPTTADRIDGLSDASFSETGDLVETNYLGGSGYKSRAQTLKDSSLDISGHFKTSDAPQGVLRTAFAAGTTVFVTIQFDANAAAGSKGKRVPMLVESLDEQLTTGDVVQFSAKLVGNGAPVGV